MTSVAAERVAKAKAAPAVRPDATPHPGRLACGACTHVSDYPELALEAPQWLEVSAADHLRTLERTGPRLTAEAFVLSPSHAFVELT